MKQQMPTSAELFARIDPEQSFAFSNANSPSIELPRDLEVLRQANDQLLSIIRSSLPEFLGEISTFDVPGQFGGPAVPVRLYRARECAYPNALMIWVHGGGFVAGSADDPAVRRYTAMLPVLSVEYRLAPESRAPAAAEDVVSVLEWVAAHAGSINVDASMIVLAGASAGGGLALGSALMSRDRGGPSPCYLLLLYPMLDDQHDTISGHLPLPDCTWTRRLSLQAWSLYAERSGASPYTAPLRSKDFRGLPPAYLMTGELDLFRDEIFDLGQRLSNDGVPTEMTLIPGALHAFDVLAPQAKIAQRAVNHELQAMAHALDRLTGVDQPSAKGT